MGGRSGLLDHPSIVAIHDRGTVDGQPYFVMELVQGTTLAGILGVRRTLPAEVAATIARSLAEVYTVVHSHGILRNDIKPSNVMVTEDGHLKLFDFGISKILEDTDTVLTKSGVMVGTVGYAAPELFSGGKLDERSDVFSLVVVLYEMLTGERPFQGPSFHAVLNAILSGEMLPPSKLVPLDPELEAIVVRGLAMRPSDRFDGMDALAQALAGFASSTLDLGALARSAEPAAGLEASGSITVFSPVGDDPVAPPTAIALPPAPAPPPAARASAVSPAAALASVGALETSGVLVPPGVPIPPGSDRSSLTDRSESDLRDLLGSSSAAIRVEVVNALAALADRADSDLVIDLEQGLLYVVSDAVEVVPLGKERLVIGRDPVADIVWSSASASKQHAALVVVDDGIEIEDPGSTNGIFVNGDRVSRAMLGDGDELVLAADRFQVHVVGAA